MDNTAANAVTLVAAQGAGNQIFVEGAEANLQFGTIAYATSTGNLNISYSDGTNMAASIAGFITTGGLTGGASLSFSSTGSTNAAGLAIKPNQSIVATLSLATKYTAGDSPIVITLRYRVLSVS